MLGARPRPRGGADVRGVVGELEKRQRHITVSFTHKRINNITISKLPSVPGVRRRWWSKRECRTRDTGSSGPLFTTIITFSFDRVYRPGRRLCRGKSRLVRSASLDAARRYLKALRGYAQRSGAGAEMSLGRHSNHSVCSNSFA